LRWKGEAGENTRAGNFSFGFFTSRRAAAVGDNDKDCFK